MTPKPGTKFDSPDTTLSGTDSAGRNIASLIMEGGIVQFNDGQSCTVKDVSNQTSKITLSPEPKKYHYTTLTYEPPLAWAKLHSQRSGGTPSYLVQGRWAGIFENLANGRHENGLLVVNSWGDDWSTIFEVGCSWDGSKRNYTPAIRVTGDRVLHYHDMKKFSSRALKDNIAALSRQEAFDILAGLDPVKYHLKTDATQTPHLGFIAEDVPEIVASKNRDGITPDHIVAALTRVVKEQQQMLDALTARLNKLDPQS